MFCSVMYCTVCHFLLHLFHRVCMHLVSLSVSLPEYVQHYILFISATLKGTFFCGWATVVLIHMLPSTEPWKNIKAFYDLQVWVMIFLELPVCVRQGVCIVYHLRGRVKLETLTAIQINCSFKSSYILPATECLYSQYI